MIRSDVRLSTPSHHSAVADTVSCFEGHFADRAVVGSARIGISDGVGVDSGTMRMSLFTSNVLMFVERVLEHGDGYLDGLSLDFLNGNFNLEGLLDGADLPDCLRDLDGDFLNIGSGDLYFIRLVDHFGVLDCARDLNLVAFVDNCGCEVGSFRTARARGVSGLVARAVHGSFNGDILANLLAVSLELHDSALFDLGNLAGPGHHVHDSSWLLNDLVFHNLLGVDLLNGSHLDLLFHFGVLDLVDNSLELRLLLVGVLVLDGLRLIGYWHNLLLGRTGAVGLSRTATATC